MTMHRQLSHIPLIDAVSADQKSVVVSCFDPLTRFLTIAYRLDSSVATLAGTLTIRGGADPDPATHFALTSGLTAFNTISGAAAPSSGVVAFTTVAIGSAYGLLRIADPPPYVSVEYDYTSGGGTNRMRVKAVY